MKLLNNPNFQGLVVLFVVLGAGFFLLLDNSAPASNYARPAPQSFEQVNDPGTGALENQLQNPVTAQPTQVPPPTAEIPATLIPPTAALDQAPVFLPPQIASTDRPTSTPFIVPGLELTPTFPVIGSTPIPSPTGIVVSEADNSAIEGFAPPAEQDPPLSLQPFDHFYLRRPVNAGANGTSLFYYPYGSTGQVGRIHHGVDMPNPVGELVVAANSGTVVWAGMSLTDIREGTLEVYASYGNVVVIEHDFSWEGRGVYTLYAHLEAILVARGERVELGQPIGLVGDTGWSTGAHVHFEVRAGINDYWNTRNPLLWIVPYLGHGVVAGRVVDEQGEFIDDVVLQINRGGRQIDTTRSYMQPKQSGARSGHVVVDENWQENFVFGDVPEGEYEIVALVDNERYRQTVRVFPGMVNFVEFQVNAPPATPFPQDNAGPE